MDVKKKLGDEEKRGHETRARDNLNLKTAILNMMQESPKAAVAELERYLIAWKEIGTKDTCKHQCEKFLGDCAEDVLKLEKIVRDCVLKVQNFRDGFRGTPRRRTL